ncbi:hypothetical protein THTE_2166 [Thermogutta terrifontis]|uniref:Uncharacterized protein n=1 Tax=Thermogutta terrifontis TaxID=1331910 RepID=A0A286RFN1_9BACT|nr:hypothetical protein THTE_2166 [Thermogutta terrifontis]
MGRTRFRDTLRMSFGGNPSIGWRCELKHLDPLPCVHCLVSASNPFQPQYQITHLARMDFPAKEISVHLERRQPGTEFHHFTKRSLF